MKSVGKRVFCCQHCAADWREDVVVRLSGGSSRQIRPDDPKLHHDSPFD